MTKYYTLALLASMFLFMMNQTKTRQNFLRAPFYLGLFTFIILILPHIVWLFSHDFITVKYVFERTNSIPCWTNHFRYPLKFSWEQLQAISPSLILFSILFLGSKPNRVHPRLYIPTYERRFLFYVGMGPFLLTVLLSLLTGIKLRAGWGMPLLTLWGLIIITYIQPVVTKAKFIRFFLTTLSALFILLFAYIFSLVNSRDTTSANFPGKEIAQTITDEWHNRYHSPLTYVAGSRWVGGNIGFYSKDHPNVFIEWDDHISPWINIKQLQKQGAVFVWSITDKECLPQEVKKKFATLSSIEVKEFEWKRNHYHLPPLKIGLAFLPPTSAKIES